MERTEVTNISLAISIFRTFASGASVDDIPFFASSSSSPLRFLNIPLLTVQMVERQHGVATRLLTDVDETNPPMATGVGIKCPANQWKFGEYADDDPGSENDRDGQGETPSGEEVNERC